MRHEWTEESMGNTRYAVHNEKADGIPRLLLDGGEFYGTNSQGVLREVLRLAARVRELEAMHPPEGASRRVVALEESLREAYWVAHDAWNSSRFGRERGDETKELRREMAGVLARAGVQNPAFPDNPDYPAPWTQRIAALEEENRRLREALAEGASAIRAARAVAGLG